MANLILCYPNRADGATLSGGSWLSGLPLTNLQDRLISSVARSSNLLTTSTKFDCDLGSERSCRVIALIGHNITLEGTVRFQGSNVSNFASLAYDSGVIGAWPTVYSEDELEWEEDNYWTGTYTEEEIEGFTWSTIHVLPEAEYIRYWRVLIDDPENPDGYVDIGRLFISGEWQPDKNASFGAGLGYETNTQVEQSLGGAEYFDVREPFRVLRFTLEHLDYDEGHSRALELTRKAGIDKEVFVIFDPSDQRRLLQRSFLGRLRVLNPLEYPHYNTNSMAFEIKEIQ